MTAVEPGPGIARTPHDGVVFADRVHDSVVRGCDVLIRETKEMADLVPKDIREGVQPEISGVLAIVGWIAERVARHAGIASLSSGHAAKDRVFPDPFAVALVCI